MLLSIPFIKLVAGLRIELRVSAYETGGLAITLARMRLVGWVGFEPTSLPHGTCSTDKRVHQLLNQPLLTFLYSVR